MSDLTGWKLVPVEPTPELLRSMAIRFDHGLGCPGYYDQPTFGAENVGHEKRLQSTLTTMRQLHEEVVGTGYYRAPPSATLPSQEGLARVIYDAMGFAYEGRSVDFDGNPYGSWKTACDAASAILSLFTAPQPLAKPMPLATVEVVGRKTP